MVHPGDPQSAAGESQRRLDGLGQAQLQVWADPKPVDHHLDIMLLVQIQLGRVIQFIEIAVDARADEALGVQLGKHLLVLAFALVHHRCQQHQTLALGQGQHLIDHLGDRLRLQRLAMLGAMRRADAGVEQAQIIMHLGDGADGGARIV